MALGQGHQLTPGGPGDEEHREENEPEHQRGAEVGLEKDEGGGDRDQQNGSGHWFPPGCAWPDLVTGSAGRARTARSNITITLANSAGWSLKNPRGIQRWAPLTGSNKNTANNPRRTAIDRSGSMLELPIVDVGDDDVDGQSGGHEDHLPLHPD